MQIQLYNVRSRETLLRQAGEEEFVDQAFPRDTNPTLLFAGRMSCDDDAAMNAFRSHWHIWVIVETAHDQAFRTVQQLIGRQVQAGLNARDDQGPCSLSHASRRGSLPGLQSPPLCHIVHQSATGRVPARDDVLRDQDALL